MSKILLICEALHTHLLDPLMNVSLETKFCSVCVFLIVTPSKLSVLAFDFSAQGQP